MRQQTGQLALIVSAALALAACTTTPQTPAYPISQPAPAPEPPPPPPPPPPPAENGATAVPTQPVTSAPLPPPAAAAPAPAPTPAPAPAAVIPEERPMPPPQTYAAPPPPPPSPPVTVFSVTGRVVDADGPPQVHTVKRGDTIDAIAREFGITRKQLTDLNDIEAPYLIKPGQKLKGPQGRAKAYTVSAGDTMFAISRRFNVTPAALAEANGKKVDDAIRPGQKLILPKGYKDTGPLRRVVAAPVPAAPTAPAYEYPRPPAAPAPTPAPAPAPAAAPAAPPPAPAYQYPRPPATPAPAAPAPAPPTTYPRPAATPVPAAPRPAAPAIIDTAAPPSDQDVIAAGRGKFVWPLQGDIMAGFGPKPATGQRSDGINIRSAAGAVVRAAAAGEVVYAGDQVPEFGNLVLIKHADGWVTAYAHLQRADVKMRQTVTQGQQIGAAGMSGGVAEPQLHFEVRYAPTPKDKARPIDPTLVLPR